MKKLRYLLTAVLSCLFMMGMLVYADTYQGDGYTLEYRDVTDGNATIISCTISENGDVIIPSSINGYKITSICVNAFCKQSSLTSVTIPNSVTLINTGAFYGCTSLTSVNIPNSVTTICISAFADCTSLKSITIPRSVTNIVGPAFGVYYSDADQKIKPISGFTAYVDKCSAAEYYCKENGINYVATGPAPTIKLSKTKVTLKPKKSYVLKISKLTSGDSVKSVKIDKKSVATVKKVKKNQYKITGKKKGSAKITVVLKSGLKKVVKVTVK